MPDVLNHSAKTNQSTYRRFSRAKEVFAVRKIKTIVQFVYFFTHLILRFFSLQTSQAKQMFFELQKKTESAKEKEPVIDIEVILS